MRYMAFIGLGSNLASSAANPAETVRSAIRALGALGKITAQSSLYRTAPVGFRDQPDFINAVVRLSTDLEPESLLDALLQIERRFGRDRLSGVPKGPRSLDLDLLLVDETAGSNPVVLASPTLTLPHPEMAVRRFVLEPLAEIAPEAVHPVLGKTAGQLLEELVARPDSANGQVARLD